MIIFGQHASQHLIATDSSRIIEVWLQQDKQKLAALYELVNTLRQQGLRLQYVPKKTLDKLSEQGNHQGIVLRCKAVPVKNEDDLHDLIKALAAKKRKPLLLVLDGVKDPHNLGACLRSADAAGVDAVIIPKNRAVALTPVVHKVACGASESVPLIQVTNLVRELQWLKKQGIWLIGTADEATDNLYQTDTSGAIAWVMGAEEKGMRRLTREECDTLVNIPMQGMVESLNVSVATGVCLFESVRQRLKTAK